MGTRTVKGNGVFTVGTIPTKSPTIIAIPRIDVRRVELTLVGDSPLIVHAWSEKAKKMMLDKQTKAASMKKEAKDPEKDYQDSMYKLPDGDYGFPSIGFKAAAVAACRFVTNIKMTEARGAFHIDGEMVKINGTPNKREDMVRLQTGVADIRYRGEFKEWSATFEVKYNANVISPEQIINLFNVAGFGVGVGEWRPSTNGSFGMFHVQTEAGKVG